MGGKQKLYTGPIDDKLADRINHELGHYVYFNVASKGDPKRRKEFYLRFNKFFEDLKKDLIKRKGNYEEKIQKYLEVYNVTNILYESFACFCSFLYNDNNFSQFQVLQNWNSEAYQAGLSLCRRTLDQPDIDYMLDVLEKYLPASVIPKHQKEAFNDNEEVAAKVALNGTELMSIHSHYIGEYLGAKMHQHSKSVGIKEVSDMVLGIGNHADLPPEMRIGTEDYHPRAHIAYLHNELSHVSFKMPNIRD